MPKTKLDDATHPTKMPVNPQSVLDNLPEGVLIADREGHITYVNLACERMFGYPPGELAGQNTDVLIPDHLKVAHQEHRKKYFALPSTIPMSTRQDLMGKRKDGTTFPVAISLSQVKSAPEPLAAAFIVDLTQQKEREREIARRAEIIDRMSEVLIQVDKEWRIAYVNNVALTLAARLGFKSQGDLLGRNLWETIPALRDTEYKVQLEKAMAQQVSVAFEVWNPLLNMWRFVRAHPIPNGLEVFAFDITARKLAQEKQARLLDIIQRTTEGLYILDEDWRLTYMNEQVWEKVQQIFPGSTSEELLGRSFWDVFSYVAGTEYDTQFRRAVAEQTPVEFDILSPGLKIWLNVRAIPLSGDLVVYTQDIDARKRAEEELQERIERRGIIIELGNALLGGMALPDFLQEAAKQTAQALRVEIAGVWRLLPERQQVVLEAGVGWGTEYVGRATLDVSSSTFVGHVLSGDPAVFTVEDARTSSSFVQSSLAKEHGILSSLGVVLRSMGRRYGVLTAASTRPRSFSNADIEFVTMAATLVSAAIERGESSELIEELSTPVLPLDKRILVAPIVGALGTNRIRQLGAKLLQSIRAHRAKVVVLDLTGVPSVEPNVALETAQLVKSAQLLGAHAIVTGVSAALSKVLVEIGLDMSRFTTAVDLQGGVERARRLA